MNLLDRERKKIVDKPLFRNEFTLLDKIRNRVGGGEESAIQSPQQLVAAFKDGISQALGIYPQDIEEGPLRKWINDFVKSFIAKDQFAKKVPSIEKIREMGLQIGSIIGNGLQSQIGAAQPPQEPPEPMRPRQEPQRERRNAERSDLSVNEFG